MRLIRSFFLSLIFLWSIGFFFFVHHIDKYTLDIKTSTNAIILINSEEQGLYAASHLLSLGYSSLAFVMSEKQEKFKEFFKEANIMPEQFIFAEKDLASGKAQIKALNNFITKHRIKSVRIIGRALEMPRIMIELPYHLAKDIFILPHQISEIDKNYNTIFFEYNKFLITLITSYLGINYEFDLPYS